MQLNKTTIIITTAILILMILGAGCLKPDTDGDGYADEIDDFPNDPRYNSDNDHDGYADEVDDLDMQSLYHVDSDGDGRADEIDAFPNDPKYKDDADGDGYADKIDAYPNVAYAHEKSWWVDQNLQYGNEPPEHNAFYEMTISSANNLFGIEINGIGWTQQGGYRHVLTEERKDLFKHTEPHFDPYFGYTMPKDQADELVDQYGYPKTVVMEMIDLDQDGAMDKVAVKYVGTDGEWTEEFNYFKAASLKSYIQAHMDSTIYPELIISS